MKNRLTIGMPVFNDKDFIVQSLDCLLSQTFSDYVLIISDDASSDGTSLICQKYAQSESRITYIRHEKNLGISRNMQFLLSQADTEFFMWAGDDDLYDPQFIQYHINALEHNPDAISAFGGCVLIDERGMEISEPVFLDYGHPQRTQRLKNYIRNSTDYFGYGVFRTKEIKDVEFPVWWWPNHKTPYNNIYPTLCYYLAKGDFILVDKGVLFKKRVKSEQKTHHLLVGKNNAIKESFAFWIRKLNLSVFSFHQIRKAAGLKISLCLMPVLFYYWTVVPSFRQFSLAFTSFFKNRLKFP